MTPKNDIDPEPQTWADQLDLVESVDYVKQLMIPSYRKAVDETPCFAWLWKDENGECDQMECSLRSYCQQAWQLSQVAKGQSTERAPLIQDWGSMAVERSLTKFGNPKRHIHKKTGLYKRKGYSSSGRKVDLLIRAFTDALGTNVNVVDPVDGKKWSKASSALGRVVLKRTASYHALIVDGVIISRLWTNTPSRLNIDIVPELVSSVVMFATMTNDIYFRLKKNTQASNPTAVPEKLKIKLYPCTHRFYTTNSAVASDYATLLRETYNF